MSKYSILFLSLVFLLAACQTNTSVDGDNTSDGNDSNLSLLPTSSGGVDEVLIVMDEDRYLSTIGDTVMRRFRRPFFILPQPEPALKVSYVDYANFTTSYKRFKNIVFIGALNESSLTADHIREAIGEEAIEKCKNDDSFYYTSTNNQWAKPQLIIYMFAPNKEKLQEVVNTKSEGIVKAVLDSDLSGHKSIVFNGGRNEKLAKELNGKHGFEIDVPSSYQVAKNDDSFVWLRGDAGKVIKNIFIDYRFLEDGEKFSNQGLEFRNRLGKFVETSAPDAYMTTEELMPTVTRMIEVDGQKAYENRGLWKMENDFSGGPYINYCIYDEPANRVVYIEGFILAIGEEKRTIMREMEVILSTYKSR